MKKSSSSPKVQTKQQKIVQKPLSTIPNIPKSQPQQNKIKDNDYAIIYQSQKYIKLIQLRAGDKFQALDGAYRHINFINQPWGSKIPAFNKPNQHVYVLPPKSTLITQTLSKKTQILYPMDNSSILFKLNIQPGQTIIQAGTGSGSLSCAFSQLLGSKGKLYTYQFNKQRADSNKIFFQNLNKNNIITTCRDIVNDGFHIQGHNISADALFLDIPNPWSAISKSKQILKKRKNLPYTIDSKICCFSPCIQQVQKTCDQLRKHRFKKLQTVQCLSRQFQLITDKQIALQGIQSVKRIPSSTRAVHNNRGHTGYLTFAISC